MKNPGVLQLPEILLYMLRGGEKGQWRGVMVTVVITSTFYIPFFPRFWFLPPCNL